MVPPAAPSTIYINDPVDNTGLYRSFDDGQTWQRLVPDPEYYVATLAGTGQDSEVMYLIAGGCAPPYWVSGQTGVPQPGSRRLLGEDSPDECEDTVSSGYCDLGRTRAAGGRS